MSTPEALYNRREFFDFARKRSKIQSNQAHPAKIDHRLSSSQFGHGGGRFTRREAIPIIAVGGMVVLAAAARLLNPQNWFTSPEQQAETDWRNLSSNERIQRLEFKRYPNYKDFDPTKELVSSTAEYFCSIVGGTTGDLINKTLFVDSQRIIEEIEFDNNKQLTVTEKERYGKETVELHGIKRDITLINADNVARETNKVLQQSDTVERLKGRDAYTILLKSFLLHGYTHSIIRKDGVPIQEIVVQPQNPITFNRLDGGFVFVGKRTDGSTVLARGANEAITDYIATAIGQETGLYANVSTYAAGVTLIDILNMRAGVSVEDFMNYCTTKGSGSQKDLLRRWGALKNPKSPDEQAATLALFRIGLRVDNYGNTTQEQTLAEINGLLKPS